MDYWKYAFQTLYSIRYLTSLLLSHKLTIMYLRNTWGWYVVRVKAFLTYLKDINKYFMVGSELRFIEYEFKNWYMLISLFIYIHLHQSQVLEMCERENLSHDFFSLAMWHSLEVCSYIECIVGRVRFHMVKCDFWCTTQNSGVMVVGEKSNGGSANKSFYGVLDEVLYV